MPETTVISVRGKDRTELLADATVLYVGRRCAGWPASVWGNPFKPGMRTHDAVELLGKRAGERVAYPVLAPAGADVKWQTISPVHRSIRC